MKITKPKFTWKTVRVAISKIRPTPNNSKLKTEAGLNLFNTSVAKFGRAGAVILNADYTLINGNTNIEKAKELGETHVDASMPNKKLTPKEFEEFAAMFDHARAGEVDMLRIKEELGTKGGKAFFKQWGLDMPEQVLSKLAATEAAGGKIIPNSHAVKKDELPTTAPVTLLFTREENKMFLDKAENLYKRYKVDNVTDLVFKVFKQLK